MGCEARPDSYHAERLEELGLVYTSSTWGEGREPDRRIYAITRDGHEALKNWFNEGVPTEHQRDEFYVKLMIGLISGEADPARIIQTQRSRLFQEMHDATTQRDKYDPHLEMAKILLLDKAIMHLEADLRWLDMIEMRLETIKDQPMPEPEIRKRGRPKKIDAGAASSPSDEK